MYGIAYTIPNGSTPTSYPASPGTFAGPWESAQQAIDALRGQGYRLTGQYWTRRSDTSLWLEEGPREAEVTWKEEPSINPGEALLIGRAATAECVYTVDGQGNFELSEEDSDSPPGGECWPSPPEHLVASAATLAKGNDGLYLDEEDGDDDDWYADEED